jgi:ubiquinone/menaquinone biosynthesis C-methylase UbiE
MSSRAGRLCERWFLAAILLAAGHTETLSGQAASPQIRRTPAPVMDASGAPWLIRPEREEEEKPEQLLEALKIRPGDVIADIGAGVGYFSLRLARRVGKTGKVLAVDIQQAMLDDLARSRDREGLQNIETILGTETDPRLLPNSIDLALLVDVYHEFSQPAAMMEKIRAALKTTGRLVLVEYRGEDPSVPIKPLHKMTERQVLEEIVPMGFRHLETLNILPRQHIVIFEKQRM